MYRHAYSRFGCGTPTAQRREGYHDFMKPLERDRFVWGGSSKHPSRKTKYGWASLRRMLVKLQHELSASRKSDWVARVYKVLAENWPEPMSADGIRDAPMSVVDEALLTPEGMAAARVALTAKYPWFVHIKPTRKFEPIKRRGLQPRSQGCTLGPAGVPTIPGDPPAPVGVFWGPLVGVVLAARPSFSFDGMRSDCPLVAPGSAVSPAPLPLAEPSEAARAAVARERAMAATPHFRVFTEHLPRLRSERNEGLKC
jgi:hypothetical protein